MDHANPLGIETSGHHVIVWRHDSDPNLVETKSFRCTFCKRGFSNAQALGGHMNIHRKDRAKLMEFELHDDSSTIKRLENGQNPNDDDMPRKNPERRLFAEVAPVSREEVDMEENRKVELINNGELDLELRLGPEPHHAKSKP